MRRRTVALVSTAAMALAACTDSFQVPRSPAADGTLAAKVPPPPPSPNVTATYYDNDTSGNPLLMRSDDYNGSGFATYATITGTGHGGMTSWITTDGGLQLLLDNQTTRTLYLVLASQGITGAPDGNYWQNVEAYTRCFDGSNNRVSLLSFANGASNGNCTVGLDFTANGTKYKLAMGQDYDAASPTGRATVTCTGVASGSCKSWTVVPNATTATTFTLTNGQIVSAPQANLYVFGTKGLVFKGSYHNSYSISATE